MCLSQSLGLLIPSIVRVGKALTLLLLLLSVHVGVLHVDKGVVLATSADKSDQDEDGEDEAQDHDANTDDEQTVKKLPDHRFIAIARVPAWKISRQVDRAHGHATDEDEDESDQLEDNR